MKSDRRQRPERTESPMNISEKQDLLVWLLWSQRVPDKGNIDKDGANGDPWDDAGVHQAEERVWHKQDTRTPYPSLGNVQADAVQRGRRTNSSRSEDKGSWMGHFPEDRRVPPKNFPNIRMPAKTRVTCNSNESDDRARLTTERSTPRRLHCQFSLHILPLVFHINQRDFSDIGEY